MSAYAHNPSASKKLVAFVLFVIGVALTVSLFYVKTRAQAAKDHVRQLERAIQTEEAAIIVLEAELAFLESPQRLAALSKETLGHEPISVKSTITQTDLIELIPLRDTDSDGGVR